MIAATTAQSTETPVAFAAYPFKMVVRRIPTLNGSFGEVPPNAAPGGGRGAAIQNRIEEPSR